MLQFTKLDEDWSLAWGRLANIAEMFMYRKCPRKQQKLPCSIHLHLREREMKPTTSFVLSKLSELKSRRAKKG